MIWVDDRLEGAGARPLIIRAPFRKTSHALGAIAFLLVVSIAPFVLERIAPAAPSKIYKSVAPIYGSYYLVGAELENPEPVDVLIVGGSDAWTSLDPRIIKADLERKFGRSMRVLNMAGNWAGEERNAQIIRDFTASHRVRLTLVPEIDSVQTAPHELAKYWWRGGWMPEGLPDAGAAQLRVLSIIGFPRQLWARFQSSRTAPLTDTYRTYVEGHAKNLGFNNAAIGWLSHQESNPDKRRPFSDLEAPVPAASGESLYFHGAPNEHFGVRDYPYTDFQSPFILAARDMTRANGGVFATFSVPAQFQNTPQEKAWVREHAGVTRDWPTIGISMTKLFPGLTFDEMLAFYGNESHLNSAGARAYTRALMPAIEELYAQAVDN